MTLDQRVEALNNSERKEVLFALSREICEVIKSNKVSIIEAEESLALVNEELRRMTKAFGE